MPRRRARRVFACPDCGEPVREGALSCPSCHSDERTGWRRDDDDDAASGFAMDDEEYEEFVADELGDGRPRSSVPARTRVVAAVLVVVLLASAFALWWWIR